MGSQATGTAVAIREAFSEHGISIKSQSMSDLLEEYNYGDDIETLKENLQIVLQQVAGYYRSQLTYL